MTSFSNNEYADIIFMYGRANGNAAAARRLYQERFPTRRVFNVQVFTNTNRRLSETGNLNSRERVHFEQYAPTVDEEILNIFAATPTTSIRKIAQQLLVSPWKVWKILHKEGKYPYHYTSVQGLNEGDPVRRIEFCRYILNADMENRLFLKSILWTDESKFSREGITNFHNLHYWDTENPHMKKATSFQNKFSVNVWAAVIGRTFIGPYFLPDNLNGNNYLEFLRDNLPDILEAVPLAVVNQVVFQNDGCPAHHMRTVRQFLDETFPNRWIGRNGPILWPARSPDLTPLDFHVWGRMKELVYEVEILNIDQLIERIIEAGEKLRQEIRLAVTTTEIRKRSRKCIQNEGSHFENMLD